MVYTRALCGSVVCGSIVVLCVPCAPCVLSVLCVLCAVMCAVMCEGASLLVTLTVGVHSRTLPSLDPDAMVSPEGEKAQSVTAPCRRREKKRG